jgi:hypothetical protein
VWLTFEEIGEFFHCDSAEARRRVIAGQWERRRCNDGLTQVKLPGDVAHDYMLGYAAKFEPKVEPLYEPPYEEPHEEPMHEFDAAMAALRRVFGQVEQPAAPYVCYSQAS